MTELCNNSVPLNQQQKRSGSLMVYTVIMIRFMTHDVLNEAMATTRTTESTVKTVKLRFTRGYVGHNRCPVAALAGH